MKLGIYIHIPYCLQICPYCDFAKYEVGKIPDQQHYTQLLLEEIRQKHHLVPKTSLSSIYFGGGTPSLLSEEQFSQIIGEIKKFFSPAAGESTEITIEINPGNLDEKKLVKLLELGVNRFSVGSQTFDNNLLKDIGRKHSAKETADTLKLLNKYNVNFTMDLLFALPKQTLENLKRDVEESLKFSPKHVSTYYLNVPDKHSLSIDRPSDETQVKMFELIEKTLEDHSLHRYEISNYAKPGFESRHNMLYWTDQPYWGVGLSSHSFLEQDKTEWGMRFWNPKSYEGYEKYVRELSHPLKIYQGLASSQIETLEKHQSMTEFCYTSLRKMSGLDLNDFQKKFSSLPKLLTQELDALIKKGLVKNAPDSSHIYLLTQEGKILSNLVFERLTFLKEDLY
jgi:oxygen-independent coproporphyrinogen-3 oxidase